MRRTQATALANLAKLAAEEEAFYQSTFIAPRKANHDITVRISGIVCNMQVSPRNFSGWGIFKANSHGSCVLEREASASEIQKYLEIFPTIRMIVCGKLNNQWYGITSDLNDSRIKVTGNVPLGFPTDIQLFDMVCTSFDGDQFWYAGKDTRRNPRFADQLRSNLNDGKHVADIPGLIPTERLVYKDAYDRRTKAIEEAKRDKDEDRLRDALGHSGAKMNSYLDKGDSYTVEFRIGNQVHTSVVDKRDLTVRSAGICLSGGDRSFDLTSLVNVIREGQQRGKIVRVGINQDDDTYDDPYDE